jgi:hypothetical protein
MKIVEAYKRSIALTDEEYVKSLDVWFTGKPVYIKRINAFIPANFNFAGDLEFMIGKNVYTDGKIYFHVDSTSGDVSYFVESTSTWIPYEILESSDGLQNKYIQAKLEYILSDKVGAMPIDDWLNKNVVSNALALSGSTVPVLSSGGTIKTKLLQ